jgi:hypothetical protein
MHCSEFHLYERSDGKTRGLELAIFGNFGISEFKYYSNEAPYARPVG